MDRASAAAWPRPCEIAHNREDVMAISLNVNGASHTVEVSSDQPLLWVLRDVLGLTGTKYGCGISQCWACSVLVDGQVTKACVFKAAEAVGKKIVTVEGLSSTTARVLQQAWIDAQVPQCGYCQSGMLVCAAALLARNPAPKDEAIAGAMKNICVCGTYPRVREAIRRAAAAR
jgi:isoquinoline 1-oxidoreductase alpha subunit